MNNKINSCTSPDADGDGDQLDYIITKRHLYWLERVSE